MLIEADLLQKSIRFLLNYEQGTESSARDVWELSRKLYAWQTDFDPYEELFPSPRAASMDFEMFLDRLWDEIKDSEQSIANNMERAFNICLAAISLQAWDDDRALQMLFVVHPNLVIEKFCMLEEQEQTVFFQDDEIDALQDLMVNRLGTAEQRITTLNFLRKAGAELKKSGLDFYPHFRQLERKLQGTMVVETETKDRILTTEEKESPALTLVPGGLED